MRVQDAVRQVMTPVQPEHSEPKPEVKPLKRDAMEHFEQHSNSWRVRVPVGTTTEQLANSEIWSFNADRLSLGDVLWVETEDQSRAWRCTVLRGGRGFGRQLLGAAVAMVVDAEYELPVQSLRSLSWPAGFTASRDSAGRWSVTRDVGNAVMVAGAVSEAAAWAELQSHASLRQY